MTSRSSGDAGASRGSTSMCREIQRLEIAFKEPMATVKAGDVLSGNIQLDVVQEFKLKGTLSEMDIPAFYSVINNLKCFF